MRLVGIETEYGITRDDLEDVDPVVESMELVRAHLTASFERRWDYAGEDPHEDARGFRVSGLAQDKEEDEFAQLDAPRPFSFHEMKRDLVLPNGARFYNDHTHPEYSTPGVFGSLPGFINSNSVGFRCVKNILRVENDPAALFINKNFQVPPYKPVGESEYKRLATYYKYDKKPLNANVISREEKENWIEEKIEFDCPLGDRITGFLFLPKNVQEPFQCIVWDPHGAVYDLGAPANWTAEILFSGNIKSGRAVFVIVPKGSPSRKWNYGERWPDFATVLYRDRIIHWVTEYRIGFDYLSTRKEIDMRKSPETLRPAPWRPRSTSRPPIGRPPGKPRRAEGPSSRPKKSIRGPKRGQNDFPTEPGRETETFASPWKCGGRGGIRTHGRG